MKICKKFEFPAIKNWDKYSHLLVKKISWFFLIVAIHLEQIRSWINSLSVSNNSKVEAPAATIQTFCSIGLCRRLYWPPSFRAFMGEAMIEATMLNSLALSLKFFLIWSEVCSIKTLFSFNLVGNIPKSSRNLRSKFGHICR